MIRIIPALSKSLIGMNCGVIFLGAGSPFKGEKTPLPRPRENAEAGFWVLGEVADAWQTLAGMVGWEKGDQISHSPSAAKNHIPILLRATRNQPAELGSENMVSIGNFSGLNFVSSL
jgi:hypothetical protein